MLYKERRVLWLHVGDTTAKSQFKKENGNTSRPGTSCTKTTARFQITLGQPFYGQKLLNFALLEGQQAKLSRAFIRRSAFLARVIKRHVTQYPGQRTTSQLQ